jgi:hypothetical protein
MLTLEQAGWILVGSTVDCPVCGPGLGRVQRTKMRKGYRPGGKPRTPRPRVRYERCPVPDCRQRRRLGERLLELAGAALHESAD